MTSKAEPPPGATPAVLADPVALSRSMADIAERSQRIVLDWQRRQALQTADMADTDDRSGHANAFLEMTARLMASPVKALQAQIGFWQDYMTLWQRTTRQMLGGMEMPSGVVGWRDDDVVDFIKQSYLLSARTLQRAALGVDRRTAQRLDYYALQFIGAMSSSSFLLTNTRVLRRTVDSGGENLLRGLNTLLANLEHGRARLAAPETSHFVLGETIGATTGAVIAQNAVMQLIQYAPTTDLVARRPLLIVPPWINKFYVLDLQPRNSFVRWAVSQGHTVFMISWVDPAGDAVELGFEDYLELGVFAATDAITACTGETEIDTLGFCLGGTLLACAAAIEAGDASRRRRIASLTLLATMLDTGEAGALGVFIDEAQLDTLDAVAGSEAARLLRSSDLIWSFVVNTFLLGNDQFPFDLLHWNADQTRLPSGLHRFYLEHIYRRNELARPGALTLLGQAIDLRRITAPTYVLAARDDHIAPWRSAYRSTKMVSGAARFVLTGSGHSGGVVNPPGSGRHNHWVGDVAAPGGAEWFAGATEIGGSWWPDWHRWVGARDLVRARLPVGALEAAPGRYVRPLA